MIDDSTDGPVPADFNIFAARRALTDVEALWDAFVWEHAPRGHEFWASQIGAGRLSREARRILKAWIAQSAAREGGQP